MTPILIQASVNTPVPEIARMMTNAKIHRLIVTDNGQYVGIVTTTDVVKVLCGL